MIKLKAHSIAEALSSLRPLSQYSVSSDGTINWIDAVQTKPTDEEITAEIVRLKAQAEANQYKQQRAAEYPSIGDQLDALFHAGVFPEAMAAQIQAIKDKYPKS